ncbi:longitudinals lacking protein isoform X2 [Bactrocera dorsalis]|uniref:Longitudinals lacking protein isoform X2 n=1 Tax=Bactrocera dorsalis TaxID=27457 RepID=A0ABM3JGH4_BACDO|nr:longitudinals lacking protein isoform X2 [Bactrocera dorsalis]XP_049308327.1 longitudinals lacking protein isoform X2 [Bactrocera dorsalis]XP_049308328.1 longitudinals lacking protein isoform X2 [Bactrocera dorsalis]
MEDDQQFCLRWNNHQSTLISVFDTLLENQTLVDCTLAAEGKFLKAHKVVLSACSPFFATLLQQQYDKHPIFILKDVKYQELRAMMDYMYRGEVNISQDQLAALLKAAESLQIKGLSDNRSGSTPKTEQHRGLNVPGSGSSIGGGGKLSGYTLEQTQSKRPRVGPSPMETADISGSREGSSSPSRRRRKVRRRSVENAMSDIHDNSNSSQINQSSLQPQQQQQPQTNASLTGVGALAAATSSLPVSASALSTGSSGVLAATGSIVSTQGTTQQMTTNITKKTESVKGASDAMNSENIPTVGVVGTGDEQNVEHLKSEKSNHKQKSSAPGVAGKETAEMVIEPKSEYEEEGNEETVEDLTLDDEEMGMDDLDQNAGTSQAGEGSSQGYAPWQHDRSQDELLLAPQEAQQRDPQDFSRKPAQPHKENTSPQGVLIQKSCQRSILNTHGAKRLNVRNASTSASAAMPPETATGLVPGLSPQMQAERVTMPANLSRKNMSMTDVSDMLINLYKANVANAPKNQQTAAPKFRQTSPTSAEGHEPSSIAAIATKGAAAAVNEPKNLQNDEMLFAAKEEQQQQQQQQKMAVPSENNGTVEHAAFHQATDNANIMQATNTNADNNLYGFAAGTMPPLNAIPTSVVVTPNGEPLDIKPVINPTTGQVMPMLPNAGLGVGSSVIKPVPTLTDAQIPSLAPLSSALERANALNSQNNGSPAGVMPAGCDVLPPAAVLAAALLRDGYNNFQQQLRTQELLKMNGPVNANNGNVGDANAANTFSSKILENFLRQRRLKSESAAENTANEMDAGDGDDEDDSRYNGFEDIHLVEGTKPTYNSSSMPGVYQPSGASSSSPHLTASNTDYMSDDSQKFMFGAHSQAFRHLEYTLGVENGANSFGATSSQEGGNNENSNEGPEPIYECRHCGKKYRWKSTLRRHENVECGGKEPSHQCPYCPYKSKQRGNLGVHVRKHHSDLPQLASKRRSKYSNKLDGGNISANASDDSSSKLIIDCSK